MFMPTGWVLLVKMFCWTNLTEGLSWGCLWCGLCGYLALVCGARVYHCWLTYKQWSMQWQPLSCMYTCIYGKECHYTPWSDSNNRFLYIRTNPTSQDLCCLLHSQLRMAHSFALFWTTYHNSMANFMKCAKFHLVNIIHAKLHCE